MMNTSKWMAFLFFPALLFLSNCQTVNDEPAYPSDLINETLFTEILVDLALSESASNLNLNNVKGSKFDTVYAFNPLIERNIRKTQYDSTLLYYSNHIDRYKKVYEKVLEILSAKQNNYQQTNAALDPK